MALTFGTPGDVVDFGGGASLLDFSAFTYMTDVFMTTFSSGGRRLFQKGAIGGNRKQANWTAAGALDVFVSRATTSANSVSPNAQFVVNVWYTVGITYDGTNGVKIYSGTGTSALSEIGSYTTQTVGSGATNTDSGNLYVGNSSAGTATLQARVAGVAYFNRILALGEMRQWQSRHVGVATADCKLYSELGYNGTGTQTDWTGNGNAGTVTGPTVGAGAPLGPTFGRPNRRAPYAVAAAGGRAALNTRAFPLGVGVGMGWRMPA